MRKSILMVIVPLAALLAAACGSSSKTTSHTTSAPATSTSQSVGGVSVTAKTIKPYGTVLVNSSGHALYTFAPDKAQKVTCTGACAKIWPPLKLPGGAKPTASGGVQAS